MKKIFALIFLIACLLLTGCSSSVDKSKANSQLAISQEEAKVIALEKAGLNAEEVIFDRVEFDRDGIDHYEIEFRKDRTEYDADISTDGNIISWEVDYND